MSRPTAYPQTVYDLFACSSKSSQKDFNVTLHEEASCQWERLASEIRRRDAIDGLLGSPKRYLTENWNGEGAAPIPETAFQEARAFLGKLPATIPLPEVIAEPDGYLGLEWYAHKWLMFVVSFNGKGALSCSGIFGPERSYGTRYMDDGIPAGILRDIAKVLQ